MVSQGGLRGKILEMLPYRIEFSGAMAWTKSERCLPEVGYPHPSNPALARRCAC